MFDSQKVMLREENRSKPNWNLEGVIHHQHLLHDWLRNRDHITLQFYQLFNGEAAERIVDYLKLSQPRLCIRKMVDACDPSLWHFKPGGNNGTNKTA